MKDRDGRVEEIKKLEWKKDYKEKTGLRSKNR